MVGGTFALLAVYQTRANTQDTLKYIIPNLLTGIFALIYLIKYKFHFKVLGRIVAGIQDALIIAGLNIYFHKSQYVYDNHLDFYLVVVIFVLEFIETFMMFIVFCRSKGD